MSTQEEKVELLKPEEALKIFKENCKIYLEMNTQERSESLKINYLIGLIKLSVNLKIDDESFITTLFDEILFKDINILKNRNLFSSFISIFEKKSNQELFQKKLFSLLKIFGNDYNSNSIYYHQYLIDISLIYIFSSTFLCEEKTKYIEMIIDNDIKPFETQLFKRIINKNEKLIDNNMNKIYMLKCLFNKFIDMNKYKSCLILFMKLLENVNGNYNDIPKDIILELIKTTNNKGFNHVVKKTKEINDFLIFNCLLLGNLNEKLFISEVEIELFDTYLVNLLNLLALKKDLNIDIFNKIFDCYILNKYKNLNKIYLDTLYYLSTYSYSSIQYEFISKCLDKDNSNYIYNKIIRNQLLSLNKSYLLLKDNQINNQIKEKFFVENNVPENIFDLNINCLFSFNNNMNNISFLSHLNLFNYIINSSFSIKKSNDNIINIYFYPKLLNKILILLNNLSLENSNKKLFEEILMFLFNLISVLFNLYFSENDLIFNEDYLIETFLKLIEKSSLDNKYLIVFPSLINIIKETFSKESKNNDNFKDNKIYNFIFDYLISNFSYNDSSNINQNILMFKSLIILFKEKKTSNIQKQIFALDKLIDLVIKSDNEKLLYPFLKFCGELSITSEEDNINLSRYSLNKYSKFINNNCLDESFIEFISEQFKELVMQKRPNNIEYDENLYFIINTINNIYQNSCIKYKNIPNDKMKSFIELIEEFCESKIIIGVCDNLFVSIERNECDIIDILKNESNIYAKYEKLNKEIENLDYYIYIHNNYFDKNIQNNKISLCHYGILKSLAYLLSGYLSNSIYNLLNEENKSEEIIINLLDYIKTKILFNETLKNTSYTVYFINCLFSNKYILHYFIVNYSQYYINKEHIKENEQISLIQEIFYKNNAFVNYIRQNCYFILFMKDIINSFVEFDSNILLGNKSSLIKNKKNEIKIYETKNIINDLLKNEDESQLEYKDNFKNMINSFFTKIFLDEIFENNNPVKSFQNKQIIFLFLFDNYLLDKYFNSFGFFINMNQILIQLYSIIKYKNLPSELNSKIIDFINKYIYLDEFRNFIIGIIKNDKIFNSIYKLNNINQNYIYKLFSITKFIMNNLIMNLSEYKNINEKILNFSDKIIEHINCFYKINPNYSNLELYLLGKIINENINNLNQKLAQNKNENNSPEDKITQINSILELIYSSIIPKYIKNIYDRLNNCMNKKFDFEYILDNSFHSFFIALGIITKCLDNKKLLEILKTKIELNILTFFMNFHCFNQNNKILVDLNYFSLFNEKYIEVRNDISKKQFLEYLYLFSLFKGKHDEKNLKSVVVEFFADYKDNLTTEDFKKYGYITCFFLSSIKKDSNAGNRNNNNTFVNIGDFSILKNLGERFKDSEKLLQKNNSIYLK